MLHIISTPIGNYNDITLRALEILKGIDYLFCEDTRVTDKLLQHFEIKKSLHVYNDFSNENERNGIIKLLKEGKNVGLVSDAGTPLISDPGYKLVAECHKNNIKVVAICGASAVLTSLVMSGMPTDKFLFWGFLENKKDLQKLRYKTETIILYESPARILFTLHDIFENLGNIEICVCREITKMYEEIKNGKVSEVLKYYNENKDKVRGEFVILLKNNESEVSFDKEKINLVNDNLKGIMRVKDISDFIVKMGFANNKKEVYEYLSK
ncbi:MAG: 16S rRNA (cytidine(1402)-2'-O)-methyltransferase [Rickettsiales bacterium]|jgi:16S rRNA (cytidine1402-2'-O)-methyltransferase|nr:16S rRNA (cytidine(1402)-2'-O)-methyltransferase [Rickettsiales bacterium]